VEIHRQLTIARRWLPLLIAGAILASIPAFIYVSGRTERYEASTRLLVSTPPEGRPDALLVAAQRATLYALVGGTREFASRVIETVGLNESPDDFLRRVSVTAAQGTGVVSVNVRDTDPERAAMIANETGDVLKQQTVTSQPEQAQGEVLEYLDTIRSEIGSVQARVRELEGRTLPTPAELAELGALQDRLAGLFADYERFLGLSTAFSANRLVTIEAAVPPARPADPPAIFFILLAATAGFLAASALAFILASRDDTLRGPREIREAVDLPELGAVEERKGDIRLGGAQRLVTMTHPRSAAADAYRELRSQVELAAPRDAARTIMVTSAFGAKTAVAANLAIAYARTGARVLLIDADLRDATVHAHFGLTDPVGLADLLVGEGQPVQRAIHSTRVHGLSVLPAGVQLAEGMDLLGTPRMGEVIANAARSHGVVIVESPALDASTDAAGIAAHVHTRLLLADRRRTRRSILLRARDLLVGAGPGLVGLVMYGQARGAHPASSEVRTPGARDAASSSSAVGHPRSP
jgi:capsular exopolysaccharide synthesis family protein